MIRRLLTRWAARWLSAAAHKGRASERDRIKDKAQSMRRAMGLPDSPALHTKGN